MFEEEFEFIEPSKEKESIEERNEKFSRIVKFLNKIGYFELIKDDKQYEDFIQKLSFEQFKNILVSFNALLRNNKLNAKGTYEGIVRVGGIKGVRKDLREELLLNVFESIKKIKDDKERASLLYYQLLRLHMFQDGNGRTSRFMYELLTKQGDFESVKKYFIHKSDSPSSTTNYDKSKEDFYKVKGIMWEADLNTKLSNSNSELIRKYIDKLPDYMRNKRIAAIPIETDIDTGGKSDPKKVEEIFSSCLEDREKEKFKEYITDNAGYFSVCSFILTVINYKKNNLDYIYENDKKRFSINLNYESFVFNTLDPNTYLNWSREDFLQAIKLGDESKKYNINILNDIFVNNNEHCGINKNDLVIDTKKNNELNSMFTKEQVKEDIKEKNL